MRKKHLVLFTTIFLIIGLLLTGCKSSHPTDDSTNNSVNQSTNTSESKSINASTSESQSDSYNEGYKSGLTDGAEMGYLDGEDNGILDVDDGLEADDERQLEEYMNVEEDEDSTDKQFDEGYKKGWQEAYSKSYKEGYAKGYETVSKELQESNKENEENKENNIKYLTKDDAEGLVNKVFPNGKFKTYKIRKTKEFIEQASFLKKSLDFNFKDIRGAYGEKEFIIDENQYKLCYDFEMRDPSSLAMIKGTTYDLIFDDKQQKATKQLKINIRENTPNQGLVLNSNQTFLINYVYDRIYIKEAKKKLAEAIEDKKNDGNKTFTLDQGDAIFYFKPYISNDNIISVDIILEMFEDYRQE